MGHRGSCCDVCQLFRSVRDKKYIGEAEVTSVQKEKMDVKELVAGETGGLARSEGAHV